MKQTKKWAGLLVASLLLVPNTLYATERQVTINDGEAHISLKDVEGTAFISLRDMAEHLKCEVRYDEEAHAIILIEKNGTTTEIDLNNPQIEGVNGEEVELFVLLEEGRTYIPLRAINAVLKDSPLGYFIEYNDQDDNIYIEERTETTTEVETTTSSALSVQLDEEQQSRQRQSEQDNPPPPPDAENAPADRAQMEARFKGGDDEKQQFGDSINNTFGTYMYCAKYLLENDDTAEDYIVKSVIYKEDYEELKTTFIRTYIEQIHAIVTSGGTVEELEKIEDALLIYGVYSDVDESAWKNLVIY
ncbi:MAG: hypothetical protein ATN35_05085 [Epulopiscium sp. Nele67-Bin004]|nr:MAG: hypothetical protein ATN35_05085 [Epulopiscium sp. Nele67-Bin004]